MPDSIARLMEAVGIALWGITGGMAQLFVSGKRPTFYALLYCIVVSGFAGLMVGRIVEASNFPQYIKEFSIGMGGFGGPVTLNLLYRKMARTTLGASNQDIEDAKKEAEQRANDGDKY